MDYFKLLKGCSYICNICSKSFVKKNDLETHYNVHKACISNIEYYCSKCKSVFKTNAELIDHTKLHHPKTNAELEEHSRLQQTTSRSSGRQCNTSKQKSNISVKTLNNKITSDSKASENSCDSPQSNNSEPNRSRSGRIIKRKTPSDFKYDSDSDESPVNKKSAKGKETVSKRQKTAENIEAIGLHINTSSDEMDQSDALCSNNSSGDNEDSSNESEKYAEHELVVRGALQNSHTNSVSKHTPNECADKLQKSFSDDSDSVEGLSGVDTETDSEGDSSGTSESKTQTKLKTGKLTDKPTTVDSESDSDDDLSDKSDSESTKTESVKLTHKSPVVDSESDSDDDLSDKSESDSGITKTESVKLIHKSPAVDSESDSDDDLSDKSDSGIAKTESVKLTYKSSVVDSESDLEESSSDNSDSSINKNESIKLTCKSPVVNSEPDFENHSSNCKTNTAETRPKSDPRKPTNKMHSGDQVKLKKNEAEYSDKLTESDNSSENEECTSDETSEREDNTKYTPDSSQPILKTRSGRQVHVRKFKDESSEDTSESNNSSENEEYCSDKSFTKENKIAKTEPKSVPGKPMGKTAPIHSDSDSENEASDVSVNQTSKAAPTPGSSKLTNKTEPKTLLVQTRSGRKVKWRKFEDEYSDELSESEEISESEECTSDESFTEEGFTNNTSKMTPKKSPSGNSIESALLKGSLSSQKPTALLPSQKPTTLPSHNPAILLQQKATISPSQNTNILPLQKAILLPSQKSITLLSHQPNTLLQKPNILSSQKTIILPSQKPSVKQPPPNRSLLPSQKPSLQQNYVSDKQQLRSSRSELAHNLASSTPKPVRYIYANAVVKMNKLSDDVLKKYSVAEKLSESVSQNSTFNPSPAVTPCSPLVKNINQLNTPKYNSNDNPSLLPQAKEVQQLYDRIGRLTKLVQDGKKSNSPDSNIQQNITSSALGNQCLSDAKRVLTVFKVLNKANQNINNNSQVPNLKQDIKIYSLVNNKQRCITLFKSDPRLPSVGTQNTQPIKYGSCPKLAPATASHFSTNSLNNTGKANTLTHATKISNDETKTLSTQNPVSNDLDQTTGIFSTLSGKCPSGPEKLIKKMLDKFAEKEQKKQQKYELKKKMKMGSIKSSTDSEQIKNFGTKLRKDIVSKSVCLEKETKRTSSEDVMHNVDNEVEMNGIDEAEEQDKASESDEVQDENMECEMVAEKSDEEQNEAMESETEDLFEAVENNEGQPTNQVINKIKSQTEENKYQSLETKSNKCEVSKSEFSRIEESGERKNYQTRALDTDKNSQTSRTRQKNKSFEELNKSDKLMNEGNKKRKLNEVSADSTEQVNLKSGNHDKCDDNIENDTPKCNSMKNNLQHNRSETENIPKQKTEVKDSNANKTKKNKQVRSDKKIGKKILEMDKIIKTSLSLSGLDIDLCLISMNWLDRLQITEGIWKKCLVILKTIKKCRKFSGSEEVRKKADHLYKKFIHYFMNPAELRECPIDKSQTETKKVQTCSNATLDVDVRKTSIPSHKELQGNLAEIPIKETVKEQDSFVSSIENSSNVTSIPSNLELKLNPKESSVSEQTKTACNLISKEENDVKIISPNSESVKNAESPSSESISSQQCEVKASSSKHQHIHHKGPDKHASKKQHKHIHQSKHQDKQVRERHGKHVDHVKPSKHIQKVKPSNNKQSDCKDDENPVKSNMLPDLEVKLTATSAEKDVSIKSKLIQNQIPQVINVPLNQEENSNPIDKVELMTVLTKSLANISRSTPGLKFHEAVDQNDPACNDVMSIECDNDVKIQSDFEAEPEVKLTKEASEQLKDSVEKGSTDEKVEKVSSDSGNHVVDAKQQECLENKSSLDEGISKRMLILEEFLDKSVSLIKKKLVENVGFGEILKPIIPQTSNLEELASQSLQHDSNSVQDENLKACKAKEVSDSFESVGNEFKLSGSLESMQPDNKVSNSLASMEVDIKVSDSLESMQDKISNSLAAIENDVKVSDSIESIHDDKVSNSLETMEDDSKVSDSLESMPDNKASDLHESMQDNLSNSLASIEDIKLSDSLESVKNEIKKSNSVHPDDCNVLQVFSSLEQGKSEVKRITDTLELNKSEAKEVSLHSEHDYSIPKNFEKDISDFVHDLCDITHKQSLLQSEDNFADFSVKCSVKLNKNSCSSIQELSSIRPVGKKSPSDPSDFDLQTSKPFIQTVQSDTIEDSVADI